VEIRENTTVPALVSRARAGTRPRTVRGMEATEKHDREGTVHYWIDLFTTESLKQFLDAGARTSGWSEHHAKTIQKVAPGDILICYVTVVQKWIGAMRVIGPSADERPIWGVGIYPVRLEVEPAVLLDLDTAVPMARLKGKVDFYQTPEDKGTYKGFLRTGLTRFQNDADGDLLLGLLEEASGGPTGRDWSAEEVELIVEDYFAMFEAETDGDPYDKTEHRRLLKAKLSNRSDGSIEFKHQNISAVLAEMGRSYIHGYKPRGNYQKLLASEVMLFLDTPTPPVPPASTRPWKEAETPPPMPSRLPSSGRSDNRRLKVDFARRDANNRALGKAGEELVMLWEKERLEDLGRTDLVDKVKMVSLEDDSRGYDISSFDEEGDELFIEVKTTTGNADRLFFVSRNELDVSHKKGSRYRLYRVYNFRENKNPGYYRLSGPLDETCEMQIETYSATSRGFGQEKK
jgi:hypothetical protein